MVKHIVMWQLKEVIKKENEEEIKNNIKTNLESLVGVVPGLIAAEVITDLLDSSTFDLAMVADLEDAEALKGYAEYPEHVHVADTYVRPYTCGRKALDFEI